MVRLLLSRATHLLSSHSFYVVWTRTSAVTLLLQGVFSSSDSSVAEFGITFILGLLLVSGVLLLALGIRDLIRDLRHYLDSNSHNNTHAHV